MAPIARRSSTRLQGRSLQNLQSPASASKLSSLVERDETPDRGVQSVLNSIAASAPAKPHSLASGNGPSLTPSATRTHPSPQDMHPSRHQSTAKKMVSAKRIGTANAHLLTQSPSNRGTPTKYEPTGRNAASPVQNPFSSPSFDFRFTRPSSDLSSEAQKLMDEVREQAAKIKSELAAQRTLQQQEDQSTQNSASPRKVASATGKMGRFSDVHMQQFRKMNSIAHDSSAVRHDLSRGNKSLKRSTSKAGLDKIAPDLARSPSTKFARAARDDSRESPAKRYKKDVSASSPLKASTNMLQDTTDREPAAARGLSNSNTAATPTKSSLARSSSVKSLAPGRSMIPSLQCLPSNLPNTPQALKPAHPNTEGKIFSSFAHKLTNVKSILRRPQLKFSNDPFKLAAGTHVATPDRAAVSTGEAALPSVPKEMPVSPAHRKEKHVNFSSSPVKLVPSSPVQSPSPTKAPVQYPTLPIVSDGRDSPTDGKSRVSAAGPSDFTFRADKTISFAQPNQTTPTIRRVRPSEAVDSTGAAHASLAGLPSVPHGLSNKKRKRESAIFDDDDEAEKDKENNKHVPDPEQSPAKRAKTRPAPQRSPAKPATGKLKSPTKKSVQETKRRGVLSLSRLNALAKPKQRG